MLRGARDRWRWLCELQAVVACAKSAGEAKVRRLAEKEGGDLERDARAAGGEAGEKAGGQAGEARGWDAGMGRDGRVGTGWAGFEMATRLSKANTCSANLALRLLSKPWLALWSRRILGFGVSTPTVDETRC